MEAQSHLQALTIMLARVFGSIFVGVAAFILAVLFQFEFVIGTLMPLDPPDHPAQDGIERIPSAVFWLALLVAIAGGVGTWLISRRVSTKRTT
jgi:uncharacterized membrane protein